MAADQIIDECIDDLQKIDFDDDGMPNPDRAEYSFVYRAFPRRHRRAYNELFFRRTLVTVVKVAHDLANPRLTPFDEPRHAGVRKACAACDDSPHRSTTS